MFHWTLIWPFPSTRVRGCNSCYPLSESLNLAHRGDQPKELSYSNKRYWMKMAHEWRSDLFADLFFFNFLFSHQNLQNGLQNIVGCRSQISELAEQIKQQAGTAAHTVLLEKLQPFQRASYLEKMLQRKLDELEVLLWRENQLSECVNFFTGVLYSANENETKIIN